MAKWGKCDYKQLKRLQKKMEKFEEFDADIFTKKAVNNLARRLLKRTEDLTPHISGTLIIGWKASEIIKVGNDSYEVEVYNDVEYAMYVEYGHRQMTGRFVPGYWKGNKFIYDKKSETGMVLKAGWVNGRHMLQKATDSVDRQKERIIEKMLEAELKKIFNV